MVRLHVRSSAFYKVLNNIGPNICVLDISTTLEISPIFLVEILVPYHSHSITDPHPFEVTQTLVLQSPQPMPLLSSVIACKEEIEVMLEDQLISTREGYQRYIIKWKGQPGIYSIWLTEEIDSDVPE
jgi:hypothetical protein